MSKARGWRSFSTICCQGPKMAARMTERLLERGNIDASASYFLGRRFDKTASILDVGHALWVISAPIGAFRIFKRVWHRY